MSKLKIIVCSVWIFLVVLFFSFETSSSATAHTEKPKSIADNFNLDLKPAHSLVVRFDDAIQKRFLTVQDFGMRRIVPVNPPSPHLDYFEPINDEERASVADFAKDGWKVSLYLYGRRAMPKKPDDPTPEDFVINYKLNKPLPITHDLKKERLPSPKGLMKNVKAAFLHFQTPDDANENEYEFKIGKWSYVAKPVRVPNESCLKCHTDYVVTEKIKSGQYKFRPRQVGDANGVIVYGFTKDKP